MIKIHNHFTKSCSSNFKFLREFFFQENLGGFRVWKVTLKTENALFLMALHQVVLQDINKSSQYVHLGVKMYWIPPAPLWFSTTVITLMLGILHTEKIMHKFENWEYLHSAMAGKRKYKQFHVALGKCNPSDALQKKKKICNFLKITQRMNLKFLNLSTPSLSGNNERAAMVGVSWERAAMAGVSLLLKPWNWFQISSYFTLIHFQYFHS